MAFRILKNEHRVQFHVSVTLIEMKVLNQNTKFLCTKWDKNIDLRFKLFHWWDFGQAHRPEDRQPIRTAVNGRHNLLIAGRSTTINKKTENSVKTCFSKSSSYYPCATCLVLLIQQSVHRKRMWRMYILSPELLHETQCCVIYLRNVARLTYISLVRINAIEELFFL